VNTFLQTSGKEQIQLNNNGTGNKTLLKAFLKGNTHCNISYAILSYSSQSSYK
jgi:hypothetical protein